MSGDSLKVPGRKKPIVKLIGSNHFYCQRKPTVVISGLDYFVCIYGTDHRGSV
jgi:hypothetical protein